MASYTTNLNLLKKDPVADASDTFNIQTMLNDNWDKIDAAVAAARSAEEYDAAGTYAAGDYCVHDGKLYKCTEAITAGEAWNAAHWAETSVGAELTAMLAHIGDKSNPHGVTPAQIGAATTAELEAALAHTHKTGEIMLASSAVSNLPENVLPCTGGYYDKTVFSQLFDVLKFGSGFQYPLTTLVEGTFASELYAQGSGFHGYDCIRGEQYLVASSTSLSVYGMDGQLKRTVSLPFTVTSVYDSNLKFYDGVIARYTDGKCYVSTDGGATFQTYSYTFGTYSTIGMTSTTVYFFGYTGTNPYTAQVVRFNRATKVFTQSDSDVLVTNINPGATTNPADMWSYASFSNEPGMALAGICGCAFYDEVNVPVIGVGASSTSITAYKNVYFSEMRSSNETTGLYYYIPGVGGYSNSDFIPHLQYTSILGDHLIISGIADGKLVIAIITIREGTVEFEYQALNGQSEKTRFHVTGCFYSYTSTKAYVMPAPSKFRVPNIDNLDNTAAYIYTGED